MTNTQFSQPTTLHHNTMAGLVDAYLALGKVREALKAARDAVVSFSLSWEAHYSMGLALMKTQDGGEEVREWVSG